MFTSKTNQSVLFQQFCLAFSRRETMYQVKAPGGHSTSAVGLVGRYQRIWREDDEGSIAQSKVWLSDHNLKWGFLLTDTVDVLFF